MAESLASAAARVHLHSLLDDAAEAESLHDRLVLLAEVAGQLGAAADRAINGRGDLSMGAVRDPAQRLHLELLALAEEHEPAGALQAGG